MQPGYKSINLCHHRIMQVSLVQTIRRLSRWPVLIIGLIGGLLGCSSTPHQTTDIADQPSIPPAATAEPTSISKDEILYRLLLAEIAGQRGQLDIAVDNLLDTAQRIDEPAIAERATRAAIYGQDYSQALVAAQRWVELVPDNAEALRVTAALAIRQGDSNTALDYCKRLLVLAEPDLQQSFLVIASLLGREGKDHPAAALDVMQQLVDEYPDHPYAHFAYGNLATAFGNYPLAATELTQALALQTDFLEATLLHAQVLHELGEVESAINELAAAVKHYPDNDRAQLAYARMLLSAKRYPEAKTQFEVLLKRSPNDANLIYTLGLLTLDMDQYAAAIDYLQQLLTMGQRVSEAYYYLGRIAEMHRQYKAAINHYFKVEQGEYRLDAQIRIAQLLAVLGRVEQAQRHLHSLREQNPEPAMAVRFYLAEASILSSVNRQQSALDVLNQALVTIPGNTDLLYTRAMLYESMDRLDLLEQDLRAILAREPENADALNALGYTLADRTDRYQEAYQLIQQAMQLKPNNAAITDSMGWVLYRLGQYAEAARYLQRALDLEYDPEIAAHLGQVLWSLGQPAAAKTVLDQALEKTPDDEQLHQLIQRLEAQGLPDTH